MAWITRTLALATVSALLRWVGCLIIGSTSIQSCADILRASTSLKLTKKKKKKKKKMSWQ